METETSSDDNPHKDIIMRSKSKSPMLPPERPSASWGFGTPPHDEHDDSTETGQIIQTHDDEGYSSRERERRKLEIERKRKIRKGPELRDGLEVSPRFRSSLSNYRAVKIGLFKNGDPWFGPVNFHYLPGRDVTSLDSLFAEISPKMDLATGVSYMFDTEGRRITSLDQIQDGGVYVCSASKRFQPGNYGVYGDGFAVEDSSPTPPKTVGHGLIDRNTSKSGLFQKHRSAPQSASTDFDFGNRAVIPNGGFKSGGKPSSGDGRVIRIINADQQNINERVLLNLKTTQPFEEVLVDLGQVLKIRRARLMCTKEGLEVKGFNQLRGIYAKESTFLISAFRNKVTYEGPELDDDLAPVYPDPPREPRRNSDPVMSRNLTSRASRLSRAPSRAHSDQGRKDALETEGGSEPISITIKGK